MTYRSGDTGTPSVIERHHAAIAQRQLYLPLALLTGDFPGHRTVHFIGQPVLASHRFYLQHLLCIMTQILHIVIHIGIMLFYRMVVHICARRLAEHVFHGQVNRADAIGLLEDKTVVSRSLPDHIYGRTLAIGNPAHPFGIFLLNHHSHPFLAFVTHDFLSRQGGVAHRQSRHVNLAPSSLHQLGKRVQMAAGTMIVNRNDGIAVAFGQGTNHIRDPLLHFRVGPLHGIELDGVVVLSGSH